jgi:hypothetical protein
LNSLTNTGRRRNNILAFPVYLKILFLIFWYLI